VSHELSHHRRFAALVGRGDEAVFRDARDDVEIADESRLLRDIARRAVAVGRPGGELLRLARLEGPLRRLKLQPYDRRCTWR
jgi:hypothetical protein